MPDGVGHNRLGDAITDAPAASRVVIFREGTDRRHAAGAEPIEEGLDDDFSPGRVEQKIRFRLRRGDGDAQCNQIRFRHRAGEDDGCGTVTLRCGGLCGWGGRCKTGGGVSRSGNPSTTPGSSLRTEATRGQYEASESP